MRPCAVVCQDSSEFHHDIIQELNEQFTRVFVNSCELRIIFSPVVHNLAKQLDQCKLLVLPLGLCFNLKENMRRERAAFAAAVGDNEGWIWRQKNGASKEAHATSLRLTLTTAGMGSCASPSDLRRSKSENAHRKALTSTTANLKFPQFDSIQCIERALCKPAYAGVLNMKTQRCSACKLCVQHCLHAALEVGSTPVLNHR